MVDHSKLNFDFFHIVLVEPQDSSNIGAVARAMSNFGFTHLNLVCPRELNLDRAAAAACWGATLLDAMTVHQSLAEALEPMQEVVGFSTRSGRNRTVVKILPDWAAALREDPGKRTALVFGPEDSGLRQEHLALCRCQVRIPTNAANPSLNLAQAVLLTLYELNKVGGTPVQQKVDEQPDWGEFEQLHRHIAEAARRSDFFREGTPAPVPALVRSMFMRINPNRRELDILLGLFGRINRTLQRREADFR